MMAFDNIIIFGDLHEKLRDIILFTKEHDIRNSVFIGVGDFGAGFQKNENADIRFLNFLNPNLKSRNNFVFTIRGNHDKPYLFEKNLKVGNIELLPDYSVLNINGLNFLFIGGAVSVDRKPNKNFTANNFSGKGTYKGRKLGYDYWEDEVVKFLPDKINELSCKIDVVITHSAPHFCHPQTKSNIELWMQCDKELGNDVAEERHNLTAIYDLLKKNGHPVKNWYYGHFHHNYSERIDDTDFILLDKEKFVEHRY